MTDAQLNLAAAFINAEAAKCNAAIAQMEAANTARRIEGKSEAYLEDDFHDAANALYDLPQIIQNAAAWA